MPDQNPSSSPALAGSTSEPAATEEGAGRPFATGGVVLGRALVDRDGDLWWRHRGTGKWRSAWTAAEDSQEDVAASYGPVREVLLVWLTEVGRAAVLHDGYQPPTPEPDSGGWDRRAYDQLLHEMRDQHLDGYADRLEGLVDALLADQDRLKALVGDENQPGWDGCSRAEAIRQAKASHEEKLRWVELFEQVKGERDTARARIDELTAAVNAADEQRRKDAAEMERLRADLALMTTQRDRNIRWGADANSEADRLRGELAEVTVDRDQRQRLVESLAALRAECEREHTTRANRAEVVRLRGELDDRERQYRDMVDQAERREALIADHRRNFASCVWVDPGRMSGAPCLGGTRIPVSTIAGLLADGLDGDQVREFYPDVTDGHIVAVRHFVAEVDGTELRETARRDGAEAAEPEGQTVDRSGWAATVWSTDDLSRDDAARKVVAEVLAATPAALAYELASLAADYHLPSARHALADRTEADRG